jgi:hypothetical protein
VICDAGCKSANNAIHLSRPLMIFLQLPREALGNKSASDTCSPKMFAVDILGADPV